MFRNERGGRAGRRRLRARVGVVALATVALAGVACVRSEPSGKVAQGPAKGGAVQVVIEDGRFKPDVVEVPAGEETTIEIRNEDSTVHDFAVESLDVNTGIIESGGVATATLTVDDSVEFVCTLHPGMKGRIGPT